ncbi:hypothetical protein AVEN_169531-1 [Araneus ventricosus]|uniref:Jerky-like n=1 Tax=Araneus ventricosus TaxID=182803 RepID=A0A4Y2QJV0_ARAVE|nr:hypothetical protein AVEN_169531-1 [Araneus ventricosus]
MPRRFAGETSVNDRKFKGSGQNAVPTRTLVPTGGYSTTRCLTGRITTANVEGFENSGIKEITDWLNCELEDSGFQFLNDEEIIAEVRHSLKEDEEEDDEGENKSQVKISNNDAFECFSKDLAWLEQQEQCDSSEIMLLRKLLDRAPRQRMNNLRQMKLPFKLFQNKFSRII